MMSDASEMLAAALEQMDGIIAGNRTVHTRAASRGSLSGHGLLWSLVTSGLN